VSSRVRLWLCTMLAIAVAIGVSAPSAFAATPWWHFTSSVRPAILKPGSEGIIGFRALNLGDAPTTTENAKGEPTPVIIAATLPTGLVVKEATLHQFPETELGGSTCSEPAPRRVECIYEASLGGFGPLTEYEYIEMSVAVAVENDASGGVSAAEVSGGGAASARLDRPVAVGETPPAFGTEEGGFSIVPEEEGGAVDARAGSHPFQLTTNFALNQTDDTLSPPALARDLRFSLPPGLVANAAVFPRCGELAFLTKGPGDGFGDLCPSDTALGVVDLTIKEPEHGNEPTATYPVPVFNLTPRLGEPVRFGFYFLGIAVPIDFSLRTGGDYGATATVGNITEAANFLSETLTIWGVPGESVHDESRGWSCLAAHFYQFQGKPPCTPSLQTNPAPFLTLPTSCAAPFAATVEGDSWPTKTDPTGVRFADSPQDGYSLQDGLGRPIGLTTCNQLPFSPFIEVAPDVQEASTSTGLTVHVRVPQEVNENALGRASSSVKDITVALPEGMAVNPAGGNGLEACSESQVGFTGSGEFNPDTEPGNETLLFTPTLPSPFCSTASKIGTVDIVSPLLPATQHLKGAVYLADQNQNPFGSLIAAYIVAEDPISGVLVKLPGEVHLTEAGQLVTTFKNSPELPFEDAELHFFGGERAPLATPSHCGTYVANATFSPWSGTEPVSSQSSFEITAGPHGGQCPSGSLPFAPSLTSGATNTNAGSFSPLTTTIGREDGNQDMQSVQLHMPPGLEGALSGVQLCAEAQANEGTCGPQSLIGETTVSAGVGSDPVSVTGGRVYLTEKYDGAPFGLSIVNPVKAGPFDLEHDTSNPGQNPACDCVVVRAKIVIDPITAQLTVTTDSSGPHAIPRMIDGIPLQIKKVNVLINRPGFTFNPTNCDPFAIGGVISGYEGGSQSVSTPFQTTNCALLKFAPKFTVSTSGTTSKANGASLFVKLTYPSGAFGSYANVAKVKVSLPKQLPSRLTTLQKACKAETFAVNPVSCPKESIVGHAKVITSVVPVPLTGPAYFVSHGGEAFPDLTIVLQGYGITVDLVGSTQIKHGVTTTTFKATPDVPFSSFELTLPQGKFSALAANANLCASKLAMPTEFTAQNGALLKQTTPIAVSGCKRKLTNRQLLAKALAACRKKGRPSKRMSCEKRARKRYPVARATNPGKSRGK
jgi:hypothetical protein